MSHVLPIVRAMRRPRAAGNSSCLPTRARARRVLPLMAAVCACALAGCVETAVRASRATPLPQFLALSRDRSSETYRLAPGDILSTRFYFNPQLDEDVAVRPDGSISLTLVGDMPAGGKTAAELSADVTKAFAPLFVKSNATVIVRQFSNYRVFTGGQLRNPGQLNLITGARTVLESLAASGGVTDQGTLTHVFLIRRLSDHRSAIVADLNVSAALSGKDPSQDVSLMPDDYVFVPRSGAADVNLALQQYVFNNLNLAAGVGISINYNANTSTLYRGVLPTNQNTLPGGTTPVPMPTTSPTPTAPAPTPTR
jgi:polysaccharide biosynthesis/export protein